MTVLVQSKFAAATATQEYSNTNTRDVIIDKCTAYNGDAAPQTLTAWIMPAGSSGVDSSAVRLSLAIPATSTYLCAELVGDILGAGDSLWFQAGTASVISIRVTGRVR